MHTLLKACVLCLTSLAVAEESAPTLQQRIATSAAEHRFVLAHENGEFSGPAWELLVREGRQAQFFLLGEEHGIAENPALAGALFAELATSGYRHMAIEISPPMASALDNAAAQGLPALTEFLSRPGSATAFFGMAEEAQMLAEVRATVSDPAPVLWGLDYEVLADRHLLQELQKMDKPEAAQAAMAALITASTESWKKYAETRGPQHIFSFAGDPALVHTLQQAWPDANPRADWMLRTLAETLSINQLWVAGNGWGSNQRRAQFNRDNFRRYWLAEKSAGRTPRVFAKFGASHMVRGRNMTEVFDLGALLPEIAAMEGGHSFHLLVLPGNGAEVANFDPTTLRFAPAPAKDGYAGGLDLLLDVAKAADHYVLIDLRPLRPLLGRWREEISPQLMRVVHGFDALLLMNGSTASTDLHEHGDTVDPSS